MTRTNMMLMGLATGLVAIAALPTAAGQAQHPATGGDRRLSDGQHAFVGDGL